jgi:hypothetical protein
VSKAAREAVRDVVKKEEGAGDFRIQVREMCRTPELLAWARRQGMPWDSRLYRTIASTGNLDVLQFAVSEGAFPSDARARMCLELCLPEAAGGGHLEMVKWIIPRVSVCDEWVMPAAAKHGHLHILQWLHQQGFPWNEWVCQDAAVGGHLHIIRWVREHGCTWDEKVAEAAVTNGHLELLKWCLDNGCPCSDHICDTAAAAGQP